MSSWQVLTLGAFAVLLWVTLSGFAAVSLGLFGVAMFLATTAGFFLRPPSDWFWLWVPQLEPGSGQVRVLGEQVGEAFPERVVFHLRFRNLWLLGGLTVLGLAYAIWAYHDIVTHGVRFESGERPLILFGYPGVMLFPFSLVWLRERWLLRRGAIRLAIVYPISFECLNYEFFDLDGERRGGSEPIRAWTQHPDSDLSPVLLDPREPDFNKPGFDFLFHKFAIVDRQHWPIGPAEVNQPAPGDG